MRLFLIFRNIKVEEVFIAMENTNELHNDNPLQSLTLCLDSAQIRQLLATIDFRENDVFRHTFGSEDESGSLIYPISFSAGLSGLL